MASETRELTNSMRSKFAACHRAYKIAYVDMIRPLKTSDALAFGTAMHALLEIYWSPAGHDLEAADAVLSRVEDRYVRAVLWELYQGYVDRYYAADHDLQRLAVEARFDAPLMNPETGGVSKTWHLAGKIDAIAATPAGQPFIVEHKTTSQDIGPGSDYWRKLPIDGQVSGYYCGAQTLGFDVQECMYDVIRKPALKPYKATPADKLKYNKDGSLSKLCRLEDESPEDFGARVRFDIQSRPDYYYARLTVARSQSDLVDYLYDVWAVGREIAEAERMGRFSRNPNSCSLFGGCEYFDVCTGCAGLDDATRFQKLETANPELAN